MSGNIGRSCFTVQMKGKVTKDENFEKPIYSPDGTQILGVEQTRCITSVEQYATPKPVEDVEHKGPPATKSFGEIIRTVRDYHYTQPTPFIKIMGGPVGGNKYLTFQYSPEFGYSPIYSHKPIDDWSRGSFVCPYILKDLEAFKEALRLHPDTVVELRLTMEQAIAMAQSKEVRDYIATAVYGMPSCDLWGFSARGGLPEKLYGFRIVIEQSHDYKSYSVSRKEALGSEEAIIKIDPIPVAPGAWTMAKLKDVKLKNDWGANWGHDEKNGWGPAPTNDPVIKKALADAAKRIEKACEGLTVPESVANGGGQNYMAAKQDEMAIGGTGKVDQYVPANRAADASPGYMCLVIDNGVQYVLQWPGTFDEATLAEVKTFLESKTFGPTGENCRRYFKVDDTTTKIHIDRKRRDGGVDRKVL